MEQKREREKNEWMRQMRNSSFRLVLYVVFVFSSHRLDAHFFRYLDLRHQLQHLPRLRPSEAELRTSEPRPGPGPPAAPATRISAARLVLWMRPPKQSHAWKTSSSTVKLQLLAIWKITFPKIDPSQQKKHEKNRTRSVQVFQLLDIYMFPMFFSLDYFLESTEAIQLQHGAVHCQGRSVQFISNRPWDRMRRADVPRTLKHQPTKKLRNSLDNYINIYHIFVAN